MENGDRHLVAQAAAGSRVAAEELFARHWLAAWRLAFSVSGAREAADDIAQDAFERAFRSLGDFDGRSSFRTWLSRIVVNRAIDLARRQRPVEPLELAGPQLAPAGDEPFGGRELLDAVLALPEERRTVVALRYWARHTPAEIAAILDLPVGTVHSRLARALADLRTRLEVADVR